MFRIGDYVVGRENSYRRSLYRVVTPIYVEGWNCSGLILEFIAFGGEFAIAPKTALHFSVRRSDQFRQATAEEIAHGGTAELNEIDSIHG